MGLRQPEQRERAAIWARVSTKDQETDNQIIALRVFAEQRGLQVVTEYVMQESAYSGNHKPQLDAALADAYAAKYTILLVWALDRLSRQGIEHTLATMRRFKERGVRVVSVQEPWTDVHGETADLLVSIMSWMAEQESKRRSERIKAGLARRKAEGKAVGRQPGAKDKIPRPRSGYVRRWERERKQQA